MVDEQRLNEIRERLQIFTQTGYCLEELIDQDIPWLLIFWARHLGTVVDKPDKNLQKIPMKEMRSWSKALHHAVNRLVKGK